MSARSVESGLLVMHTLSDISEPTIVEELHKFELTEKTGLDYKLFITFLSFMFFSYMFYVAWDAMILVIFVYIWNLK